MREVDRGVFAEAVQEWRSAPHGRKSEIRDKWCDVLGISRAKFHRDARRDAREETRSRRSDAGKRKDPRLDEWAATVVRVMGFAPKTVRRPTVKLAFRKAFKNGLLPPEAEEIPLSTYHRVIRERGLLESAQKIVRFEASRPMEMWQMDASGSEHIYVAGKDKNGGPLLKLRATKGNYKNKPQDGLRVWYYGAVDDFSGYWLARAVVAPGESSADNLAFFRWCACKKEDPRVPFYGLPETVYMDNGALARAHATTEFFKRIDVELKTHEANSPEDTGKIECRWKPLWREFEMDLMMDPHWDKVALTVDELNRRLLNFIEEENRRKHRRLPCSRTDAWLTVMRSGGVVEISPEAWDTVFVTRKVAIDRAGWFSFDGKDYEVKELFNTKARAYKGVLDGKIVVKDLRSGCTYEAAPAQYVKAGEHRGVKKQEWERIKAESKAMRERFAPGEFRGVYDEAEAEAGNIQFLPVRSNERPVETTFEKVDPCAGDDEKYRIPETVDAMTVSRAIADRSIPMTEFLRTLIQRIGPIAPEVNRGLRERYGGSIEAKEAEDVIRRLEEGEFKGKDRAAG